RNGRRAEGGLECRGRLARLPGPDRLAVEGDDGEDLADRRGREGLFRRSQVVDGEGALANLVAEPAGCADEDGARDTGEDAELEGRGVEDALAPPPDVRHRALEDDRAVGEEDRVVGPPRARLALGGHVD